jgi:WD40 repeat protein
MTAYNFESVKTLDFTGCNVNQLALSPDANTVAIGCTDGTVFLHNLQTEDGKTLKSGRGIVMVDQLIAFTPDGQYLIAPGAGDTDLVIIRLVDDSRRTLDVGSNVECVAITNDGKTIITGDDAYLVKTWDFDSLTCKKTYEGHKKFLDVVLSVDDVGNVILSKALDELRLWDASGTAWAVKTEDNRYFTCLKLTPDRKQCIVGRVTGVIQLLDIASGNELWRVDNKEWIWDMMLMDDDVTLLVASDSGLSWQRLHSDDAPFCFYMPQTEAEAVVSIVMSPDRRTLITGYSEGGIMIWRAGQGTQKAMPRKALEGPCGVVNPPWQ